MRKQLRTCLPWCLYVNSQAKLRRGRGAALAAVMAAVAGWPSVGQAQPPAVPPQLVPGGYRPAPQASLPPAAWPQHPPAATEDIRPEYLVADVHILGHETVSLDRIHSLIRTRKGRTFDEQVLQQDKQNLLTKGLFRDVEVGVRQTAQGMDVTFKVVERPTIRYIRLLGARGFTEKTLRKETGLEEKDALNFYAVEEARRKLENLYHRKGYPKARVTVREGNRPSDRGVVFEIAEGPLQRIKAVTFSGNSSIASDGRLKTQIESKPSATRYLFATNVDHDKIADDQQKLISYYRSLGFFRARVSRHLQFDDDNSWVTVHFVIDEGPRYTVRNVSVIGNHKFPTDQLTQSLRIRSGEYFKLDNMQADLTALRDMYQGQGYVFAEIKADPRFQEESELDLIYEIAEGEQFRVGRINIKIAGEFPHTKERVILDRLSIRPGDIVDMREIRNSERRLRASQLFIVNPAEGDPPQIVIVPPDMKEVVARGGRSGTYRGQGPDPPSPLVDLDVFLPGWAASRP